MSEHRRPDDFATNTDRFQVCVGQCDSNRLVLRLCGQSPRLGCLQLLERRQGTHPILDDEGDSRMDILSLPWRLDGVYDG
jgi:hypothetical protein